MKNTFISFWSDIDILLMTGFVLIYNSLNAVKVFSLVILCCNVYFKVFSRFLVWNSCGQTEVIDSSTLIQPCVESGSQCSSSKKKKIQCHKGHTGKREWDTIM